MNTAVLAVAGSLKTQSIVDACKSGSSDRKRLVLTYTLSGQRDLERRLADECEPASLPDVCGWYAFLLRHWVRPFLPLLYPGRRLAGLNFEGTPLTNSRGIVIASGEDRYLDKESRAYKRFLSKLSVDVSERAAGSVINRLQRIYDEIYIDEVQDMTGYDLDILELLLKSNSTIRLVGDIRQSVFDTNPQDPRHPEYRGLKMLKWFDLQRDAGRLDIVYSSETWRCVQQVATFADTIFDPSLGFPPTISKQTLRSPHDGVFAISPAQVDSYCAEFQPVVLRERVTTPIPNNLQATNFGISKGLTYQRVLIYPTGSMRTFLTKGTLLSPKSACGLYVGVTRAISSVAFVTDNPAKTSLRIWTPDE